MTKTFTRDLARTASNLSELSRLASYLVSPRRLLPLLTVVALVANIPLRAQTATTGEPRVNDFGGNPTDSTIFVDAKQYQQTDVDLCSAIAKDSEAKYLQKSWISSAQGKTKHLESYLC